MVNIDNRLIVLKTALVIESMTTIFLAELIGVKNYRTSKSFNGNSALSFSDRVHLLIDIGALPPKQRTPLQKFMEIRNKFMHNLEATTYEKCVCEIEGCEKWLLKTYPTVQSLKKEEQLKIAVQELCAEVMGFIKDLIEALKNKIRIQVKMDMLQNTNEVIISKISEVSKELNAKISELIKEANSHYYNHWVSAMPFIRVC